MNRRRGVYAEVTPSDPAVQQKRRAFIQTVRAYAYPADAARAERARTELVTAARGAANDLSLSTNFHNLTDWVSKLCAAYRTAASTLMRESEEAISIQAQCEDATRQLSERLNTASKIARDRSLASAGAGPLMCWAERQGVSEMLTTYLQSQYISVTGVTQFIVQDIKTLFPIILMYSESDRKLVYRKIVNLTGRTVTEKRRRLLEKLRCLLEKLPRPAPWVPEFLLSKIPGSALSEMDFDDYKRTADLFPYFFFRTDDRVKRNAEDDWNATVGMLTGPGVTSTTRHALWRWSQHRDAPEAWAQIYRYLQNLPKPDRWLFQMTFFATLVGKVKSATDAIPLFERLPLYLWVLRRLQRPENCDQEQRIRYARRVFFIATQHTADRTLLSANEWAFGVAPAGGWDTYQVDGVAAFLSRPAEEELRQFREHARLVFARPTKPTPVPMPVPMPPEQIRELMRQHFADQKKQNNAYEKEVFDAWNSNDAPALRAFAAAWVRLQSKWQRERLTGLVLNAVVSGTKDRNAAWQRAPTKPTDRNYAAGTIVQICRPFYVRPWRDIPGIYDSLLDLLTLHFHSGPGTFGPSFREAWCRSPPGDGAEEDGAEEDGAEEDGDAYKLAAHTKLLKILEKRSKIFFQNLTNESDILNHADEASIKYYFTRSDIDSLLEKGTLPPPWRPGEGTQDQYHKVLNLVRGASVHDKSKEQKACDILGRLYDLVKNSLLTVTEKEDEDAWTQAEVARLDTYFHEQLKEVSEDDGNHLCQAYMAAFGRDAARKFAWCRASVGADSSRDLGNAAVDYGEAAGRGSYCAERGIENGLSNTRVMAIFWRYAREFDRIPAAKKVEGVHQEDMRQRVVSALADMVDDGAIVCPDGRLGRFLMHSVQGYLAGENYIDIASDAATPQTIANTVLDNNDVKEWICDDGPNKTPAELAERVQRVVSRQEACGRKVGSSLESYWLACSIIGDALQASMSTSFPAQELEEAIRPLIPPKPRDINENA